MNKHFGIAILGGLILAAVTALPSFSHAMELALTLDTNVQVDVQNNNNDDKQAKIESDTRVQGDLKTEPDPEDKEDKSRDESVSEKENRSGFFGRVWAMFQGNTDKNHKEATAADDDIIVASSTVDADASTDGPRIYWLRTSMIGPGSVTVAWISTQKTSNKVWIEKDSDIDTSDISAYSDNSFSYFHKLKVDTLEANTTYYFKVASTDKGGNTTISTLSSFTTRVE